MPNSNAGAIAQVFMITRNEPVQVQGQLAPVPQAVALLVLGSPAFLIVQFSSETALVLRGDGTMDERGRVIVGCFVDNNSCHPGPVEFAEPLLHTGDLQSPCSSFTWVSDRLAAGRHTVQMMAAAPLGIVSLGSRTLIVQLAVA